MEIIEKLPDQLVNIVYSFVGKHPVAELYDDEVDEIVDSDEDELSPEQITYRILSDKRKRLRRSTPSYKIAELYKHEKWHIQSYSFYHLYPDQIPSFILYNKRKRLRRSTPSYKICLIMANVIDAYTFRQWKDKQKNKPLQSFKAWFFSVSPKVINRWCVNSSLYKYVS